MAKILAVDDSKTIQKFVSFVLKMKKHDVVLANDGIEALENIRNYN